MKYHHRNYDHVAALWQLDDWISPDVAQQARTTYGAYAVQRQDGLKIITLNTDFCEYRQPVFMGSLLIHAMQGIRASACLISAQ